MSLDPDVPSDDAYIGSAQGADQERRPSSTNRFPSKREKTDAPPTRDAPDLLVQALASLVDHRTRQADKLQRAVRHLWHLDPSKRPEITKLLKAVDADAITVATAIDTIATQTALSQQAEHRAA